MDPTGHEGEGGDGGIEPSDLPDPGAQLRLEYAENMRFILQLIKEGRWDEYCAFMSFRKNIHPGSMGVFTWSGRLPGQGDVGHAVVGVAEGVFIGTAGFDTEYGVYLTSAAELFQENHLWLQQLTIYEVQGLNNEQRLVAAEFALGEYGAGYSYAGVGTADREGGADKQWYCSELVVAALEQGGVTFYAGNGLLYKKLRTPTFPTYISGYRTMLGGSTPSVTTRWGTATPMIQTWP